MPKKTKKPALLLDGTCKPGYEEVKELFKKHFEDGKDENAQLCVYVGQECVIDLWGSSIGDENFGPDLLNVIYSSGKSVMSLAIAMMVDKGLLKYSDKVSQHWPEFGQKGKEDLTVADVLRHEAGLTNFGQLLTKTAAMRPMIKKNAVGKVIEDSEPKFPANNFNPDGTESKRQYHALTRGFILNELLRRVDPKNRTLGQLLKEEEGLMGEDVQCGIDETGLVRLSPWKTASTFWEAKQAVFGKGSYLTGKMFWDGVVYGIKMMAGGGMANFSWFEGQNANNYEPFFYQDTLRMSEIPSSNVHATARGLARLAAAMANKGKLPGGADDGEKQLISEETWEAMHSHVTTEIDKDWSGRTRFSQGGLALFTKDDSMENLNALESVLYDGSRDGYWGWMGAGGSVFQWNSDLNIGFAYVPGFFQMNDAFNLRGAKLQEAVSNCVKKINGQENG